MKDNKGMLTFEEVCHLIEKNSLKQAKTTGEFCELGMLTIAGESDAIDFNKWIDEILSVLLATDNTLIPAYMVLMSRGLKENEDKILKKQIKWFLNCTYTLIEGL
jgi:hypothetical protein